MNNFLFARKLAFVIFFNSVLVLASHAQNESKCQMLEVFLKSDETNRTFKLDKNLDSTININDSKGFFTGCRIDDIYGRKVNLKTNYVKGGQANDLSTIVIYKVINSNNYCRIELGQKLTGAYGYVELKKINGVISITKFKIGYF